MIDLFNFSELSGKSIGGVQLTADVIMDMSELANSRLAGEGRVMSPEDAEALFYTTHKCLSDDYDSELLRIESWCNKNNIIIK